LVPVLRAVLVWTVILATILLSRMQGVDPAAAPVVTRSSDYSQRSLLGEARTQRVQATQVALADAWVQEYNQGYDAFQARLAAEAAAAAQAAQVAALDNHPPPPAWIGQIITNAFSPLGPDAVRWAMRVAWCESRYHPNSVNSSSGAAGLFQFMPGTWAGSPFHAKSPFDPVANAQAAAWLYSTYGPQRWTCQ
jgi:hypothetical protein